MKQKTTTSYTRVIGLITLVVIGMMLSACIAPPPSDSTASIGETPTVAPQPEAEAEAIAPTPQEQAPMPVQLQIPELNLDMPITPMGWRVVAADGAETTTWIVPEESLGWQVNSAGAGEDGNMLIAGHQALGDALLAPLALDEIEPGQEILVTDDAGMTFRYQITEVSAPLPIAGASEDENAQAAAYVLPDGDARLTLITGWPDFTTTHRVFAVAELVGAAE